MKINTVLAASALACAPALAAATPLPGSSVYTDADMVWHDEFDGKTLNMNDWNFEFHEPGWVNAEWQSYDDSAENTFLKDGCLVIRALKKGKLGMGGFTSGRINTQGKHAFTYGRFEARLKVPKGKGFLPAFWMMPDDESNYGQWPKCGEIDIMEVMGQETDKLHGTIHFGEPHSQSQGTHVIKGGKDFHDDFHVFAVEWEPGEIRWYCDGTLFHKANDWFTKRDGFPELTYPAPFDQPFYVIFNVAVGGAWVGYPDKSVNFDPNKDDARMYVDYVRVYQKKEYATDVKKPEKAAVVAKAGNMVRGDKSAWEFMTAGGGKGSVNTDGKSHTISSTSAGNLEYSVQYVQPNIALQKGGRYRYSFEAWAEKPRTIITGITAPNANYSRRFGDVKVNLTAKKQKFTWDFTMSADDDAACRLEYNLGAQKSTATVHIENVKLEKIGQEDIAALECLPDGNYVRNGQFQEGEKRLGEWSIDNKAGATISVSNDRNRTLVVQSPEGTAADGVVVGQGGLKLHKGLKYVVSFDAAATKPTEITFRYGETTKTVKLTAKADKKTGQPKPKHFEYTYTPKKDGEQDISFSVGSDGATVTLDNVSVKERTVVFNGSFALGKTGWEVYAADAASASGNVVGNKQFAMEIGKTGPQDWMIQLKQGGRVLELGKKYRIKLRASSTVDRAIMVALQRDGSKDNNWDPYSGQPVFSVDKKMKEFVWEFEMTKKTDRNVIFTISMGAVKGKSISKSHTVTIEAISVEPLD